MESDYAESLLRLSEGYQCYRPPAELPAVTSLPALANGYVTFGSFANHLKINAATLRHWATVLHYMPEARFLLKCMGGYDPCVIQWIKETLQGYGIGPERIQIQGWVSVQEHLDLYNQIDIALDTTPFSGNLTVIEALLMGVPTVSLSGTTRTARLGAAVLKGLDLGALVADTPERMVATALGLAGNLDVLTKMRRDLRQRLLNSPLCDAQGYARSLEENYRCMWQGWCKSRGDQVRG